MKSDFYPDQRPWTLEGAQALLNLSGNDEALITLGAQQLENAVALHHILLKSGVAYLADEVGMGKTYVALAVVAMFRHLNPGFRVLYIAPSGNVRQKWASREYPAFMERNVRIMDLRVRSYSHKPPAPIHDCTSLNEWADSGTKAVRTLDTFLNLSTLSFPLVGSEGDWMGRLRELARHAGTGIGLSRAKDKDRVKREAAGILNRVIPVYDLVIIDEAHLLKGGCNSSDRVKFLARILGNHPDAEEQGLSRKFRGALLLSATPFDRDTSQLLRQLEIADPTRGKSPILSGVRALEVYRPGQGKGWTEVHDALRPFMVRRVQRLEIGGEKYSRNQYRVEHRSDETARITLKQSCEPDVLRQRFFTALVQKLLIDRCQEEGGKFPPAMMASFEAYTLPLPPKAQAPTGNDDDERVADPMDTASERSPSDSGAFDAAVISELVSEHFREFGAEPPHPKLEEVANRLSCLAYEKGMKQLVFVRRIKTVEDLKRRLEDRYNRWLAAYLESHGVLSCQLWSNALQQAWEKERPVTAIQSFEADANINDNDPLPSSKETLFSWFFRGKHDPYAERFSDEHGLPSPNELRSSMTSQKNWESLLGELDWRGWIAGKAAAEAAFDGEIDLNLVAERASAFAGTDTRISRYRRLQTAWLEVAVGQAIDPSFKRALERILSYQRAAFSIREVRGEKADQFRLDVARQLLQAATLPLGFYHFDLGAELFPVWDMAWKVLRNPESTEAELQRVMRRLDLHAELLFSLVRLDHPFIDLYISAIATAPGEGNRSIGGTREMLDRFLAQVKGQESDAFGSRMILQQLSEGWDYVIKTNFAELVRSSSDIDRSRWRGEILRRIAPHAPVEWASGDNAKSRPAIARRFRMPGYPMVLVSTSVLQEGEDLHLFCGSVTHYGLSAGPIGIEQKNGRVDRVGALAHRRLRRTRELNDREKIQVSFPHLTESLEWFQVRDLCISLNEYLRSLHSFGIQDQGERGLDESLGDLSPIPQLIGRHLESPFENPDLPPHEEAVTAAEVLAVAEKVADQRSCALQLLIKVARRLDLQRDPDQEDHFRNRDDTLSLTLLPAIGIGELLVSGVRTVPRQDFPACITWESLIDWGKNPRFRFAFLSDSAHRLRADCIALGNGMLQEEELLDILARLDLPEGVPAPVKPAKSLIRLLKSSRSALRALGIRWDDSRQQRRVQYLYGNGRGNLRIDLCVVRGWLEMSTVLHRVSERSPSEVYEYILAQNDNDHGIGFYLDGHRRIRARMVQPLKYLQKDEMLCMCRMLLWQVSQRNREN